MPDELITIPGFVNAHSHAFQRALRGRADGEDFWAWREAMLDLARGQTPGRVRTGYADVYREMLAEALRAGFKESWQRKDYTTIVEMAKRVPEAVIQEDQALLMFYDNALLMTGE